MNTFGHNFRLSLFGESHGKAVGVVIDGIPAGIPLSEADFEAHKAEWQTRKIADKSYSLVVSWLDKAIPKLVSLNIKPVQEKYGVLQPNGTIR